MGWSDERALGTASTSGGDATAVLDGTDGAVHFMPQTPEIDRGSEGGDLLHRERSDGVPTPSSSEVHAAAPAFCAKQSRPPSSCRSMLVE